MMQIKQLILRRKYENRTNKDSKNSANMKSQSALLSTSKKLKIIQDSITKLNPKYLAKGSPVMFTVEISFFVLLGIAFFPDLSESKFINQSLIFYAECAIIIFLTVWFATFSESLSEAQAKARVDSLRNLEKEVSARKMIHGKKESIVASSRCLISVLFRLVSIGKRYDC
jgi:potassium-transporting ATPase ATP-binding subunit